MQEVLEADFRIKIILGAQQFLETNNTDQADEVIAVSKKDLERLGSFKSNDGALAVVEQKENSPLLVENELVLALDDINDPGNFGTIIRIADWYGITKIVASEQTVELYNPKVIAASKGSFSRVAVFVTDLPEYISKISVPRYGAFMDGENIHSAKLPKVGLIVLGNEANGISREVEQQIDHKITIPKFGMAESLNVAMATAVICDNFKRTFS